MGHEVNGVWTGSWEATNGLAFNCDPAYPNYADRLLDMAIDEFNISQIRLEIRSSEENIVSHWQNWMDGGPQLGSSFPEYCTWRESRYATVDDGGCRKRTGSRKY